MERAQQHYRDALGFEIGWLYPGGDIGAVLRDDIAIFFRRIAELARAAYDVYSTNPVRVISRT